MTRYNSSILAGFNKRAESSTDFRPMICALARALRLLPRGNESPVSMLRYALRLILAMAASSCWLSFFSLRILLKLMEMAVFMPSSRFSVCEYIIRILVIIVNCILYDMFLAFLQLIRPYLIWIEFFRRCSKNLRGRFCRHRLQNLPLERPYWT